MSTNPLLGLPEEMTAEDWRWAEALRRAYYMDATGPLIDLLRSKSELTRDRRDLLAALLELKQLLNKKKGRRTPLFPLHSPTNTSKLDRAKAKVRRLQYGQAAPFGDFDLMRHARSLMRQRAAIAKVASDDNIDPDELYKHINSIKRGRKKKTGK
jgi:hypothetical protein